MLSIATEYDLLCRLAQGDRLAFEALYHHYFHAVYCNALKITRDVSAAEDVLQEVFITFWEKRQTLDTSRSAGGWLFVICYNKSVNLLQKKLRESIAYQKIEQPLTEIAEEEQPYYQQRQLLEEAMAQLSPQKRKVFELCKLQGKTYEETATAMQLSKYTVKEYLSAAVGSVKDYVHRQPESSIAVALLLLLAHF